MESTRGPMEQDTVSCVASRPFFTEKSTFKIGVGDVLTWRVGFNSWINTNAVDRVAHGSSDDMKMYIFLESPNLGVEYVTPYNATPLFVVIVILLLLVIVILLVYLIKIKKENKLTHAGEEMNPEDFSLIQEPTHRQLKSDEKISQENVNDLERSLDKDKNNGDINVGSPGRESIALAQTDRPVELIEPKVAIVEKSPVAVVKDSRPTTPVVVAPAP